jgi:Ni,Fe-hydrogenase III component G
MSAIEQLRSKFGDKLVIFEKSPRRIYATVAREDAQEIVRYCFRELGARFSVASGVDTRPGIEILYHMTFDREGVMITVKVMVAKPELEMPTFSDFMPAAEWIEREIHEMFGVNFAGHPQLTTLLLPDDWPAGVYPLRKKSFESEKENEEREN